MTSVKSQGRSTDPVARVSPIGSQCEIKCHPGLGSGLWTHERPEHPYADPSKPLHRGCFGTRCLVCGDKLHHNFAVIDNKTVITGSFNWSPSAAHTNDETLLVIHSPQLAKHFTREMDRLWETAELGITPHIQRKLDRQKIRCGDGVERG